MSGHHRKIHDDRGWYYVSCSKCSNKLYPQHEDGKLIFVCKDDDDVTTNFKYCVNARISDATGATDGVFFNDSMSAMLLNFSCSDMTDPKKLPNIMASILHTPWLLHLAQKMDGSIVVNDVTKDTTTPSDDKDPPTAGTSAFTPATPTPKKTASKRTETMTPDAEERRKTKKA